MAKEDEQQSSAHKGEVLYRHGLSQVLAAHGNFKLASGSGVQLAHSLRVASFDGKPSRGQPELLTGSKSASATYANLNEAFPARVAHLNPHCPGCLAPVLLGLNATWASHARGILCGCCGTLMAQEEPDKATKRSLRSARTRDQLQSHEVTAATARATQKRKQRSSPEHERVTSAPVTLDDRKAALRREAKDKRRRTEASVDAAVKPADQQFASSLIVQDTPPPPPPPPPSAPRIPAFGIRKGGNAKTVNVNAASKKAPGQATSPAKTRSSTRKKPGADNDTEGGGGGLQTFLDTIV